MPKTKKEQSSSDESDSGPDDRNVPTKKSKQDSGKGSTATQADPPNQWTLEKLRRVRINEFRGRKMVDIREFYEKGGEMLPGKKGISLSIAQWQKLLEIAPEVGKALQD